MRAVALFATLLLVLQLASGKTCCPPAITHKSPVPGMRNTYRIRIFYPACDSVYSAFTSVYTSTHGASSTSSTVSPSSTPTSPAQPPFVVDGFEAFFGSFRGDLNIPVTFCPSPVDHCIAGPPFPNQTVLTNCTDECWMVRPINLSMHSLTRQRSLKPGCVCPRRPTSLRLSPGPRRIFGFWTQRL
jgi:hypothetical protein